MQIPFVGGAYESRSLNLDAQRCVNLYPVVGESGSAKNVRALFGTPGLRRLTTLDGGTIRAVYTPSIGNMIVVSGHNVYSVATDFSSTLIGTIDESSFPVSIKDDGFIAVLVTGPSGYVMQLGSNSLAKIDDEAFYGSVRVDYNDGNFIFDKPGTNQFYTATRNGNQLVFDALDFASAESNGEPIVSHIVNHDELMIFKNTVTEIWRNVGNVDFPYERDKNATIEQGCAAPYSLVPLDNTVFWLGRDKSGQGMVWRMNGYTPLRVSDGGVERAIQGYSDISDAIAYAYQQEGETFYVLNFPSAQATWVYGIKANLWHERAYLRPSTGLLERHRSNCHAFYAGLHVVGDWENGNLYALDLDCFDDNGDPLLALRSSPHTWDGQNYYRVRYHSIQVDIEAGVGLNDGQGSMPTMMIRWSDDGANTWSSQHRMTMGRIGGYLARARITRLGWSRDRVFEVSISDPVKRVIMGAAVNAEGMTR